MGNSSWNIQCSAMEFQLCTMSHCKNHVVIARNMHIKFGVIWTYGDNVTFRIRNVVFKQRGLIQNWNNVMLWFLCKALRGIARNMHTNSAVILTYGDKSTMQSRNALSKSTTGYLFKIEVDVESNELEVIVVNMHNKFGVIWTYGDNFMLQTRSAL